MISIIHCAYCFQALKDLSNKNEMGELPLWSYEHICEYYVLHKEPIEISEDIHMCNHGFLAAVHFLEKNRFIYTKESGLDTIKIIPRGIYCEDNDWHFCALSHIGKR